jgi:hypothetical protein
MSQTKDGDGRKKQKRGWPEQVQPWRVGTKFHHRKFADAMIADAITPLHSITKT